MVEKEGALNGDGEWSSQEMELNAVRPQRESVDSKPWILPCSQHAFLSMLYCLPFHLWGCVYLALCLGERCPWQDGDLESVRQRESRSQRQAPC